MPNSKIIDFLVHAGVYGKIDISINDREELEKIIKGNQKYSFDAYCPHCKSETTFSFCDFQTYWETMNKIPKIQTMGMSFTGFLQQSGAMAKESEDTKFKRFVEENNLCCLTAHCSRHSEHTLWIFIKLEENRIIKIGQFPDVKLIQSPRTNKYEKLLGKWFIELKTAINLHAHNVGVGSYVYLRRIFEGIILDKYHSNKEKISIDEKEFLTYRMDEKIEILKTFLPTFIVENKTIYSILSKGIHELDEEECNQYFDTIERSIEMILDEIIEQNEKEKNQKSLSNAIASITGKMKKRGGQHK